MPAAAVIPASIAYITVVAVKKARSWISAEDSRSALAGEHLNGPAHLFQRLYLHFILWSGIRKLHLEKIKGFRHALVVNTSAWNNKVGRVATLFVCLP